MDIRIVEPLGDARFSMLDPSGRRVTVAAVTPSSQRAAGAVDRTVERVIPGSGIEATAAKRFYADYLGFGVRDEWPGIVMFQSRTSAAQVLAAVNSISPDAFDLDVGTPDRVDAVHAAAMGNAVVMGSPQDFPDQGVHLFLLLDPNGVAINVSAPMGPVQRAT